MHLTDKEAHHIRVPFARSKTPSTIVYLLLWPLRPQYFSYSSPRHCHSFRGYSSFVIRLLFHSVLYILVLIKNKRTPQFRFFFFKNTERTKKHKKWLCNISTKALAPFRMDVNEWNLNLNKKEKKNKNRMKRHGSPSQYRARRLINMQKYAFLHYDFFSVWWRTKLVPRQFVASMDIFSDATRKRESKKDEIQKAEGECGRLLLGLPLATLRLCTLYMRNVCVYLCVVSVYWPQHAINGHQRYPINRRRAHTF